MKRIEITNGSLIAIGFASLFIIFSPTVKSLIVKWLSDSSHYSHGILLIFVMTYILYKEWRLRGQYFYVRYRVLALAMILVLSLIWLFAQLAHVQVITQLAFILILAQYLVGLFGYKKIGTLLFPILLLFTAVPVWEIFSEPLQYPTALMVDKMLVLTGYNSFREGYVINIPEGAFKVSSVCSGLNNQIAAIVLSLLLGYFYRLRFLGILILCLLGITLAFISNSIRIYIVVLAGHYTSMQHSLIHDHVWLGWVIFSIFYFLFAFWINIVLRQKRAVSVVAALKIDKKKESSSLKNILVALVLLMAAAVGPALSMMHHVIDVPNKVVSFSLPDHINEWSGRNDKITNWNPAWIGADLNMLKQYKNNFDERVDFFLSYYFNQEQGKEAVNAENTAFVKEKWSVIESAQIIQNEINNKKFNMKEIIIQDDTGRKRILWQWYNIGGQRIGNDLYAKFVGLLSTLNGNTDAAVFIVSTEVDGDYPKARERLSRFTSGMIAKIENILSKL